MNPSNDDDRAVVADNSTEERRGERTLAGEE